MEKNIANNGLDKSKEFILEFFKDAAISHKNGVLTIDGVQKSFEDFIGKKAPYKLVFDIKTHSKVKDSELIMQGSYFLLSIRDYLMDRGQTSLLKINIRPDLTDLSKNFPKGSKIIEVKQDGFDFFSEFYFLSVYQYLNEKKQSINNILVKNKEVLDLDTAKLKFQTGNKEEIPVIDLNDSYKVAKDCIKNNVVKEIKPMKLLLKEKLEKELKRVKEHYIKQIKEKDEEVETCERKIKLLQSKLRHTYYERDMDILEMQIRESKERLEKLKKKGYKERLKKEELFHVTDETEKHSLSIKNNLINATVFYYPLYKILISSKGKKRSVKYDAVFSRVA
ncbi:MAG: hypothetical protein KKE23_01330 [Nanoarchaeota archaeon]|nr:hypothetical protein [Nanoarchaeota archaeon]